MILVKYTKGDETHFAFLIEEKLYTCHDVHPGLPDNAEKYLKEASRYQPLARLVHQALVNRKFKRELCYTEIGQTDSVEVVVMPQ